MFLPGYLFKCWDFIFFIKSELWAIRESSLRGFSYETVWFAHTHIWLWRRHTHPCNGMLGCTLVQFCFWTHRHTQTHNHTSLSCSVSLSFCSSKPSSWWMVISASASLLVCSWSSSAARDDRPLLCNISSNFFMDSSLLEENRFKVST